jgi:hypothetical protein
MVTESAKIAPDLSSLPPPSGRLSLLQPEACWPATTTTEIHLALAAVRYLSITSPARAGWSPSGSVTQSAPLKLS